MTDLTPGLPDPWRPDRWSPDPWPDPGPAAARDQVTLAGLAFARINWSRIVVDCPRPQCTSALTLPPGWQWFECLDCGWSASIVWPPNLADIVAVLALRPDPITRNWDVGQTVMELVAENLAHGLAPDRSALEVAHAAGPLVLERDNRIVGGTQDLVGDIPSAVRRLRKLASQDTRRSIDRPVTDPFTARPALEV